MPTHLLTKDTFDVAAKTMYARLLLSLPRGEWGESRWASHVYFHHLWAWNRFAEESKQCFADFAESFALVLWAMQDGHFDWNRSPIPTNNGRVCNGRHRLAAAIVLNQPVQTAELEEPCDCSYRTLRRLGLAERYSDEMAIEFCSLKPSARIAVVYGEHDRRALELALMPVAHVFYRKEVKLEGPGPLNLMHELYLGEGWLSEHGSIKASGCFPAGRGAVTFYGLDVRDEAGLQGAKWNLRRSFGRGHDSLHINDSHEETMQLARALFNDNGIHFLNHAHPRTYAHAPVRAHAHGVSIDSGGVLEVYGLRPARDIDFVDEDLHLEFHRVPLVDLLEDPRNFFWSRGVKYASIPAVRRMKTNRGEAKDKQDLVLMEGL